MSNPQALAGGIPVDTSMVDGVARIIIGLMPTERGTGGISVFHCNGPELKPQVDDKNEKSTESEHSTEKEKAIETEKPEESKDSPQSDSPQPDSSQPDSPQPDSPQPDSPQPDSPQPDSPQPDSPQPDSPQPDSPQPDSPQPDSPQPDSPQSEDCKHEPPRGTFQHIACRAAVKASFKTDESVKMLCIMCPAISTIQCPDCIEARYCSQACLDLDKTAHKLICESFAKGCKDSDRPTKRHVRVLIFSQDKPAPEFGWARPRTTADSAILEIKDVKLANYLMENHSNYLMYLKSVNYSIGLPPIGHGINVHYAPCKAEFIPDSNPVSKQQWLNKAIASLGPAGHITPVYAHVVAFAFESRNGTDIVKFQDMTFRDARHTFDHFLQSPYNPVIVETEHFAKTRPMRLIPAIRFHKTTDANLKSIGVTPEQATEEVMVAMPYAIRQTYRPSYAAFRLGLRYWVKTPSREEMPDQSPYPPGFTIYDAWDARFAPSFLEVNDNTYERIGYRHSYFKYVRHLVSVNSSTMVHGSGAAIPILHFKAFCAWESMVEEIVTMAGPRVADHVPYEMPMPAWIADVLNLPRPRLRVLRHDREGFAMFWAAWKTLWGGDDDESPWEFEEAHKSESIFDYKGTGYWLGVDETELDQALLMRRHKEMCLQSALEGNCGVNAERAAEKADYNENQPWVSRELSMEQYILDDMQPPDIHWQGRLREVVDRRL